MQNNPATKAAARRNAKKAEPKRRKRKVSILEKIIRDKMPEVERLEEEYDLIEYVEAALEAPECRDFRAAIKGTEKLSLIAEVKKASPSAGIIREDFDPVALAKSYEQAGANAISVLTEENYFQGKLEYIQMVKEATSLPVLRKDFITDEYQIAQSKLAGADAILLICAVLDWRRLLSLLNLTRRFGMESLVEVHNTRELDIALIAGATLIGINNRDLKTFEVDLDATENLTTHIHDPFPVVSESGISKPEDLQKVKQAGAHAVLIGEHFMRQEDPGAAVRELFAEEWAESAGGSD